MNRTDREVFYGRLLNEHTRISNEISEIKGSNISLTKEQEEKIQLLQTKQLRIVGELQKILMLL